MQGKEFLIPASATISFRIFFTFIIEKLSDVIYI
jgi:hypothetical protein